MREIQTDNAILDFIQKSGIDSNREREANLPSVSTNLIALNWAQPKKDTRQEELSKIASIIVENKALGLNEEEIEEVLLSDGFSKENISLIFSANSNKKNIIANSYNDLKENIEDLIKSELPKDSIKFITSNDNAKNGIVKLATKESYTNLVKLASIAKNDNHPAAWTQIHEKIRPFVEEELLRSSLNAKIKKDKVKISRLSTDLSVNSYNILDDEKVVTVDPNIKTCNCDRFVKGNFEKIGLPCEHMIIVNEVFYDQNIDEMIGYKQE